MRKGDKQKKHTHRKHEHFFRKKWVIIGAIIIALFIGGAVSSWLIISFQKKLSPKVTTDQTTSETIKAAAENYKAIEQPIADAQKLVLAGDVNGAKVVYEDAIKKTDNSPQKSILLSDEATMYYNAGNYNEALTLAKQAEALDEKVVITGFIVQIYQKLGDNQKTIEYCQKTIDLIKKNEPVYNSDIENYQYIIDSISGVSK